MAQSQASKFKHCTVTKRRFRTKLFPGTYFEKGFQKGFVKLKKGSLIGSVNNLCCYKPEELLNSVFTHVLGLL